MCVCLCQRAGEGTIEGERGAHNHIYLLFHLRQDMVQERVPKQEMNSGGKQIDVEEETKTDVRTEGMLKRLPD